MTDMETKPMKHCSDFDALCEDAKSRIREVSVEDLEDCIKTKDNILLVDVRDRDEFDICCIQGACHLSKGWAEAKIHTVAESKDQEIYVYCGGGNRSALVADNLQKMGYTNVYSVAGGIKAWVNSGKPTAD